MKYGRFNSNESVTNTYFNRMSVWANLSDGEHLRIKETLAMLPKGVTSILNIGCGDGRVTNAIATNFKIVGVDTSITAVSLFHGSAILGSIDALPFKDRAFDLVLVTEVLEHLSEHVYVVAMQEIQRVSALFILITVPNNETLEANHIKCHQCGSVYHAWTHLRRFHRNEFKNLLISFRLETLRPIGLLVPVLFCWPYRILQTLGNTWATSELAVCPTCGVQTQSNCHGNRFGSIWQRIVWLLYERTPWRKKSFLSALYLRVES